MRGADRRGLGTRARAHPRGRAPTGRALAEGLHAVVAAHAPQLSPKTWYGMPAYARDGKVVVFFQAGQKFGSRYATLGFSDQAHLDDGDLWPSAYGVTAWNDEVEKRIDELVKRAAG